MRAAHTKIYRKSGLGDKLGFIPRYSFSRFIWPVMKVFMPDTLIKPIGPYRLILNGKSLSHFLRYVDLWEPRYRRSMMKQVYPGAKVLELGSAYGYFTLLLSNRVGPTGAVLAVEPFPHYYKNLVRLKDSNAIQNITLLNVAIGDSSTEFAEFGARDPNPYSGLKNVNPIKNDLEADIPASPEPATEIIKVPALTLPNLLSTQGFRPDFIVMDIEGAELFVIEQLIQMDLRPALFFEVHPSFIGEDKVIHCLRKLEEARYALEQTDQYHFSAVHTNA
jgi:FkbM family methyltransferase